jgi:hypothetical protein
MENIPLGFWLFALGMLTGWASMLFPCWLALRLNDSHEISAGSVHVKASSYKRAQALFLAAFDANHVLQQRAARERTAALRNATLEPSPSMRFGPLSPELGGPETRRVPANRPPAPRSQAAPQPRSTGENEHDGHDKQTRPSGGK